SIPVTAVMFVLAARFGRLADRHGPRLFMGAGPLVAAAGLTLMLRLGADVDYWTELLPALLVFALGLSMTVAPLTATVLADADESNAGIASGVNNAIARAANLPAVSRAIDEAKQQPLARVTVIGAPPAVRARLERASLDASVDAFHMA